MSSSHDLAVSVKGIHKTYTIVSARTRPTLFVEALARRARHPLARAPREQFRALTDISMQVNRGEAVGIIGRNGAGKSTLLKILSRITEPTRGRVEIYGRVGSLLEVGTGFHPELTGRENIALNGAVMGMKRREVVRQFDSIVEFAGVERFLETPVKRYSSGMYIRLAFAVAAHLEPDILVVDEVLAVGDAQFQKKCLGKMGEVSRQQGRTVLFVSHNMAAIESFCTRGIYLEGGRIARDGTPREAIAAYMSTSDQEGARESRGQYDLRQSARTSQPERCILRHLSIHGGDGQPTDTLRTGEPMSLTIGLDRLAIPSHVVGVCIKSDADVAIATINTAMMPPDTAQRAAEPREMVLHIPRLPLLPGQYWIELTAFRANERKNLDRVERAASFQVENADVYGAGRMLVAGSLHGLIFLDGARWEVQDAPAGVERANRSAATS